MKLKIKNFTQLNSCKANSTGLTILLLLFFLVFVLFQRVYALTPNFDGDHKWAWGENIGWNNFQPANGGVEVTDTGLIGYLWLENAGWIKLDYDEVPGAANTSATDWGVTNDGNGNLNGYAWGENIGWVNFHPAHSQVIIDSSGNFSGYAWAENVGWIKFDHSQTSYSPKIITEVSNNAPTLSTISETSTSAAPTSVGSNVTFSGTISDPNESDQVRLAICKTDAISAIGTCTGGAWCYDPGLDTWQAEGAASCNYQAQAGDLGSKNWYAYACDDSNACTNMAESDGTFYVVSPPSPPSLENNVSGFAWSENIGWISFNSINCDSDGNGITDTGNFAQCPVGQPISDYGVNINSDGTFSGYAWSENIGWINFAPAGPYPAAPDYSVMVNLQNNEVSGWARTLAYGNGWDGWIKMRGPNYEVSTTNNQFSGYAWSDMVIGAISFRGTNYSVVIANRSPNRPGIPSEYAPNGVSWNHCSYRGKSIPIFHWTYFDPEADPQTAYEVWVDDNSNFANPKFNHLVNLTATSYALDLSHDDDNDWISQLAWNTTYFWKVRVRDNQNNWSEWSDTYNFGTLGHAYPWPDFNWSPSAPSQGEVVIFNSAISETFGGTFISSYLWTITEGEGQYVDDTSSASQKPHIIFSTQTNKMRLRITDSDGFSCESGEKEITAKIPLPEYKEVSPMIWLRNFLAQILNP